MQIFILTQFLVFWLIYDTFDHREVNFFDKEITYQTLIEYIENIALMHFLENKRKFENKQLTIQLKKAEKKEQDTIQRS